MKTRFPLYAKILLWFFLNVLILAVAAIVFIGFQLQSGAELLVSTLAGERLQAMSRLVRDEMAGRPRQEWDTMLERLGNAYRVQMFLFRNDGGQLAGERIMLPIPVLQRLAEPRRLLPPNGPGGPGRGFPGLRRDAFEREGLADRPAPDLLPDGPPPADRPRFDGPPGEGLGRRPEERENFNDRERRGPPPNAPRLRFVVRTDEPRFYWIGLPIPGGEPIGPGLGLPATLLLRSTSLNPGGMLMDIKGWVWAAVAAALFSLIFWLPLVRSITRSVSQMKEATARIAEGKFDTRVNERRSDELGALGGGINQMATRLNGFVTGQKRFLGDIAHELCSPIARMQMALGILEERADPKAAPYVQDVKEEVQQMSTLVNELLSFSKASLGASTIRLQPVELAPLVERALKRETVEGVQMRNEVPTGLCAMADPELVVRALSNLLRNAARYAGHAGAIVVGANSSSDGITLSVADSGPGVPEHEIPRLFDPFYRVDVSRARETGGVGLGLAIVKTCIESCQGTVQCRNREPTGLEVTMTLPACGSETMPAGSVPPRSREND